MKRAIYVLILAVLLSGCSSMSLSRGDAISDFYLTDASGKKHGPFSFSEGKELSMGEQKFVISRILEKKSERPLTWDLLAHPIDL